MDLGLLGPIIHKPFTLINFPKPAVWKEMISEATGGLEKSPGFHTFSDGNPR